MKVDIKSNVSIDIPVYSVLKEPNIDTNEALAKLKDWVETNDFKKILDRLFVHFQAYSQKLLVDYISQDGTSGQWEPFPGQLLDGITRVCIGPGDHKARIKLLTHGLLQWYSETDIYLLSEPFINDITFYLTNQIDTFVQECHYASQSNQRESAFCDLRNHATFIYYLLTEIVSVIAAKKPFKLKLFDLLDRILESLPALPEDIFNFSHSLKTPPRQWCIQQLLETGWLWEHTLPLAALFKDLNLDQEILELVVARFIRQMPTAPPEDLPMLTYHILLMTKKMSSKAKKSQVFTAISHYFNNFNENELHDSNACTKLNVKESATLLHMGTAICQDNTLGTEYFAFVKSLKRRQITPFNISLMLVMIKVKPYKEPILAHLKKEIEALLKLQMESKQFDWLEDSSPFIFPDTFTIIQRVLQKTSHNWEILDGLISLACLFLASSSSTTPWWLSSKVGVPGYSFPSNLASYQFNPPSISWTVKKKLNTLSAKDLGLFILSKLFEMHDMVREEILELIVAQITSRSSAVPSYIELLRLLLESAFSNTTSTSNSTSFVLTHTRTFETLLHQLQHLPTAHACFLTDVLVKMTQWHAGFRNTLMLFFRKAIVNKRAELREISIHAGLTLLQSTYELGLGDGFLYEIVGLLRRCFQFTQSELKMLFYVQLAHVLETHPGLGVYVVEPLSIALEPYLFNSFCSFVDQCIENGSIKEPLHWLLKCYVLATFSTVENPSTSNLETANSFKSKLSKVASEYFQVDIYELFPTGISFGFTPDVLPHLVRALLYLGCFDALFEFLSLTQASSEFLGSFYEKREVLVSFMKKNFLDAKGRKGHSTASLHVLFDSAPFFSIQMLVRILPGQPSLMKPLLIQLASAVQQQQEYPWTVETAVNTSKLLLSAITREQMEFQTEQLRRDPKSTRFLTLALTSFKAIHSKALLHPWCFPYLEALPSRESLFLLAKDLLLYPCAREAIFLFQIIMQSPSIDKEQNARLHNSVLDLVCSASSFEEDIIVKPLFQLLFHLSKHRSGVLVLVARNILHRWGKITTPSIADQQDEDEDMKLEGNELLDSLESCKSQIHAASALCEEIETRVSEIERCLVEFKSEYGKRSADLPSEIRDMVPKYDAMLCRRFSLVLHAVLLLSKSTVKPELTLPVMKMLTNTFAALNTYLQFSDKFIHAMGECLAVVRMGSQLHETVALLQLAMDQQGIASSRQGKSSHHQAKWIASLTLQAEQFDVLVIQLAKKFKPLTKYIKRSVIRDFRFETHRISVDESEKDKGMKKKEKPKENSEESAASKKESRKRRKIT